jgi:osmotically-inducible protein OsmY
MARYHEQYGRRGRYGYDQGYSGFEQGGRGRVRGWGGYGHDRNDGAGSRAARDEGGGAALYGPARYGLGPYYQRLLELRRPDEELREEVQEALFFDTWVDAEAISVEVEDGVVVLRGELPSYEEIRYAIDDAWDVDGVRGVRAELTLRVDR